MSAETITTALFLITAVVASAVLINAVYPVIAGMAGTFSSSTHESDVRIRTDFTIIATYASESSGTGQVWMKNIGNEQIPLRDIQRADAFGGATGSFDHLAHATGIPGDNQWTETFTSPEYDLNGNQYWDAGETVKVTFKTTIPPIGNKVYFQFALPDGIWRSTEFTVS